MLGELISGVVSGFAKGAGSAAGKAAVGAIVNNDDDAPARPRSLLAPRDSGPFRTLHKAPDAPRFDLTFGSGSRSGPVQRNTKGLEATDPIVREVYFWQSLFEAAITDARKTAKE